MVKILFVSIVFMLWKTITFILTFFFLFILNQSNKILKDEQIKEYKPLLLNNLLERDTPEVIKIMIHNTIFNFTYNRVKYGWKFLITKKSIKRIIIRIILAYFNLSWLMLVLIKNIILSENFERDLCKLAQNPYDSRILIRVNNKWEYNGDFRVIFSKLFFTLKKNQAEKLDSILMRYSLNIQNIVKDKSSFQKQYLFKDKNLPKIKHWASEDVVKSDSFYGYETSYQSAYCNKFYQRKQIINKFIGESKETTILKINKEELYEHSKTREKIISKQLAGALIDGYDREEISEKYKEIIEEVEKESICLQIELESEPEFKDYSKVSKEIINSLLLVHDDMSDEVVSNIFSKSIIKFF